MENVVAAFNSFVEKPHSHVSYVKFPVTYEKMQPSIVQPPSLELKHLPEHLKYVYLGENKTLPVIITSSLNQL